MTLHATADSILMYAMYRAALSVLQNCYITLATHAISCSTRLHYFAHIYPALWCTSFLFFKTAVSLFLYNFSRPSGFSEELGRTRSTFTDLTSNSIQNIPNLCNYL